MQALTLQRINLEVPLLIHCLWTLGLHIMLTGLRALSSKHRTVRFKTLELKGTLKDHLIQSTLLLAKATSRLKTVQVSKLDRPGAQPGLLPFPSCVVLVN